MTRFQISSAVAALAIATTAAAAQTAPPPGVAQGTAPAPMAAPHPPLPPLAPGAPQVRVLVGGDHAMTRAEVSQHIGKMFARLDTNHDGFITREEVDALHSKMEGAMAHAGDFEKRLADRGVFIGDRGAMFDRLDANRDGRVSAAEFDSAADAASTAQHSPTWWKGYERGRIEGTQAGKEDKPRHWDLEGQRELETADSGYDSNMGNRADYQAGYRAGFRLGYREGFGPR